jgi:hypothetical protein
MEADDMAKTPKRRALTAEELDAEHGAELPPREALSIVFGPAPANLLPALHAAQTAATPVAEEVAPVQPEA